LKAADMETLIRKRICFVQEDSGRDEFFDHTRSWVYKEFANWFNKRREQLTLVWESDAPQ